MSTAALTIVLEAINKTTGAFNEVNKAMGNINSMGRSLTKVGAIATASVTAPIVGIGVASIKSANQLNNAMSNVEALGVAGDRIQELKSDVQELGVDTATSTTLMAGGLYEVISAFGDTADATKQLEIAAKAAKAGQTTVVDAVALTSAVTKAYGDTSADALTKVSDLALKTVEMGQTTFPELANSVGRVTPLMKELGASQEELFAVMATATGVTGSASEVSTQLRGALQSLLAPTGSMSNLFQELGVSSGAALIEQRGLHGALSAVVAAAQASGQPLQQYIGSIEGQVLALALAGANSADYTTKLAAMGDAAGSTANKFQAATSGINESGFKMAQAQVQASVLAQTLGDALAPSLISIMDALTPVINGLASFAQANPGITNMVVGFLALLAVLGPIITFIGGIVSAITTIIPVVASVTSAVAGFVGFVVPLISTAGTVISLIFGAIVTALGALAAAFSLPAVAVAVMAAAMVAAVIGIIANWQRVKAFAAQIPGWFRAAGAGAIGAIQGMASGILAILNGLVGSARAAAGRIISGIADGIRAGIGKVQGAMSSVGAAIAAALPGSPVKEGPLVEVLNPTKNAGYKISQMVGAGLQRGTEDLNAGGAFSAIADGIGTGPSSTSQTNNTTPIALNITVNAGEGANGDQVADTLAERLADLLPRLMADYNQEEARVGYA